jgi:hypothetical protein
LSRFHGICQSCWKKLSTSSAIVQLGEEEDDPALPLLMTVAGAIETADSFTSEPSLRSLLETTLLSSPTSKLDDLEPSKLMQLFCPSWLLHNSPGLASTSLESTCLPCELQQKAETEHVSFSFLLPGNGARKEAATPS